MGNKNSAEDKQSADAAPAGAAKVSGSHQHTEKLHDAPPAHVAPPRKPAAGVVETGPAPPSFSGRSASGRSGAEAPPGMIKQQTQTVSKEEAKNLFSANTLRALEELGSLRSGSRPSWLSDTSGKSGSSMTEEQKKKQKLPHNSLVMVRCDSDLPGLKDHVEQWKGQYGQVDAQFTHWLTGESWTKVKLECDNEIHNFPTQVLEPSGEPAKPLSPKEWVQGSKLEVYSMSREKWFKGVVYKVNGDVLTVQYRVENGDISQKEMERYSRSLRPAPVIKSRLTKRTPPVFPYRALVERIFNAFSTEDPASKSKYISKGDLIRVVHTMNIDGTGAGEMFKAIDEIVESDGRVSQPRFIQYFCDEKANPNAKKIAQSIKTQRRYGQLTIALKIYAQVDLDNNSQVSFEEFEIFLKQLKVKPGDAKKLWARYDLDKSNTVTFDEFLKLFLDITEGGSADA